MDKATPTPASVDSVMALKKLLSDIAAMLGPTADSYASDDPSGAIEAAYSVAVEAIDICAEVERLAAQSEQDREANLRVAELLLRSDREGAKKWAEGILLAESDGVFRADVPAQSAPLAQQAAEPPQEFESAQGRALASAWAEGWAQCRDAEFVGEEAENDAFNQSTTLTQCLTADRAAAQVEPVSIPTPERLLEIARLSGVREAMHGVSPVTAKVMLTAFVTAVLSDAGKRIPADGEVRLTQAQGQDAAPAEQDTGDCGFSACITCAQARAKE